MGLVPVAGWQSPTKFGPSSGSGRLAEQSRSGQAARSSLFSSRRPTQHIQLSTYPTAHMSIRPAPPRAGTIRGAGRVRAPAPRQSNQEQDGLNKLTTAVNQIQKHNASSLSFEEHYRHAYQLVSSSYCVGSWLGRTRSPLGRLRLIRPVGLRFCTRKVMSCTTRWLN